MNQTEADEISEAFISAWEDYFGDEMYYVKFDSTNTIADSLYGEQKAKVYNYDNKALFHGTLKEAPDLDVRKQSGKEIKKDYEISFITKELIDQGILEVDTNDIIQYIDRFGKNHLYKIYDSYQKVQFTDNKVFTKLKVIPTSG